MIVGAGNLATCLGVALRSVGITPLAVWSRTALSADTLADKLGCEAFTDISSLPDADIVITAVSDDALPDVAKMVAKRYPDSIVAHTAGSVPVDIWPEAAARHYGVFYPMQTFSKTKSVDFSKVGIFVEGLACADASDHRTWTCCILYFHVRRFVDGKAHELDLGR